MSKENLNAIIPMMVIFVSLISFIFIVIFQNESLAQTTTTTLLPSISYSFIKQWGSKGTDIGQFLYPIGIAVDPTGNVFISDNGNNRIQKFDGNGNFLAKWDFNSSNYGHIVQPKGIAADSSGNVFISDNGNNQIQKFDGNGNFLAKWGTNGTANGQFIGPEGIAVDPSGNVYVTNYNSNTIIKFDGNGNFLAKWGTNNPEDIAADPSGNVYVTNYIGVLKFDGNGTSITKWGSYGTGNGQFIGSGGVAVGPSGNVYVTDGENNRIEMFTPLILNPLFNDSSGKNGTTSTDNNNPLSRSGISDQI
jgi:tripartite motif-containing protein 71